MATGNSIGPKIQVDGVDSYYNDIKKIIAQGKELGKQMQEVGGDFEDAGSKTSTFGEMLKANLTSAAILGAVKSLADGLKGIGEAVVGFVKDSVVAFGELEQNIGGSEAVFGEYALAVQTAAAEAYRTMGATQSEYLATANKMGALFQGSGLSAQQSMELTTQAMQRAADMASVMGIDTQSALDAVTGAAKGNYTMMDNLGVAMNATTLEAYRVAKGMDKAFSKMSNAEKAELAMQYFFENTTQYAGNFEREASQTISGSIGQLTAAVQAWVAGLGNSEADITKLTGNIVNAFQSVVKNVTPVVKNIVSQLPTIVAAVLPAMQAIFPDLISTGLEVVAMLVKGIMDALPQLIATAVPLITGFIGQLANNIDKVIDTGIKILLALINGIIQALPQLISMLPTIVAKIAAGLIQNLPAIIQAGVKLIIALVQGIVQMLSNVDQAVATIGKAIKEGFLKLVKDLPSIGKQIIEGLWKGITGAGSWLWGNISGFCKNIVNKFKSALGIHSPSKVFADVVGSNIAYGIAEGYDDAMSGIARNMTGLVTPNANVRNTNLGGVSIVVNGAEGQDVNELADVIMQKMQSAVSRREAVFA